MHDAARALAPPDLSSAVAAAVRAGHDAVIPVLPVVDTIKQVDDAGDVVARHRRPVRAAGGADPAGLPPGGAERRARRPPVDALTDDAGLVEKLGVPVFCVPGSEAALKITRRSTWRSPSTCWPPAADAYPRS